jgi:hypothetical protein
MTLNPGDLVKHAANGEEGYFVRPVILCIGSNKAGGYLVKVRDIEKVWLEEETVLIPPGAENIDTKAPNSTDNKSP